MDLTIYGGTGFVGGTYVDRWKTQDNLYLAPRYSRRPDPYKKTDMLYFISTTSNYNVFKDPTLDVKTNLLVLTETLESWKNNNPEGVFNFISSWFVYGDSEFRSYDGSDSSEYGEYSCDENSSCKPKGFYAITKYCAEQLVRSFADTFGLKYRILRLSNIIGPGDKGVSKEKNALQFLIGEIVAGRPIEVYNDGVFYRNYLDVEDCAEAIRVVLEKGKLNEIYNIGKMPPDQFSDLIQYVYEKTGSRSPYSSIEPKDFHKKVQVKDFDMDCHKLRRLGWEPKLTTEQSIDRILWVDHGRG